MNNTPLFSQVEYDRIEVTSDDGIKIIKNENNEDSIINFDEFIIKHGLIHAGNLNLDGIKIVETNETNK